MDATLNWTSLCVTRHLNRAVQMKTASIFNIHIFNHNLYLFVTSFISLVSSESGPACNQLVGQLYISPSREKKILHNYVLVCNQVVGVAEECK